MLVTLNGQNIGGMTKVAVEIELGTCGPQVVLGVSRYKYSELASKLSSLAEERRINEIDCMLRDESVLGWRLIGGLSTHKPNVSETKHNILVEDLNDEGNDETTPQLVLAAMRSHQEISANLLGNSSKTQDTTRAANTKLCDNRRCTDNVHVHNEVATGGKASYCENGCVWMGCICGKVHPDTNLDFWIQCDACAVWYQVSSECVGFTAKEAQSKKLF